MLASVITVIKRNLRSERLLGARRPRTRVINLELTIIKPDCAPPLRKAA